MGDIIQINPEMVEEDAQTIADLSLYFEENPLESVDTKTTISANKNGKDTYEASQTLIAALGEAMDQEVINIRKLGLAFKEIDETYASLIESGVRCSENNEIE